MERLKIRHKGSEGIKCRSLHHPNKTPQTGAFCVSGGDQRSNKIATCANVHQSLVHRQVPPCWQPHWQPVGVEAGVAWQPQVQVVPTQLAHEQGVLASVFMVCHSSGSGPEVVHGAHSQDPGHAGLEYMG